MGIVSSRSRDIPPFIVMEILERAYKLQRQGRDIVHLEIGEPDFPTPKCICDAATEAMHSGETHYTHSLGILPLREAICEHYYNKYGVSITPDQVLVTSGTSPALFMLFSALLEPEEEIIMSNPHYPCYPNFARFLQAKPLLVSVHEEDGFQLKAEEIKKRLTPSTKAILINSPSNPSGTILPRDQMEAIVDLGLPIISDEIYHGLTYGKRDHSILEFTNNAFVLNGFSKLYAMTGWRLGYLIGDSRVIRALQKMQQNFFISAGSISQWAGIAALTKAGPDVEHMKAVYDERRKHMINRIKGLGFGLPVEPAGAFYMLINAKHLASDSYKLAFDILENVGVAVTPGIDFGSNGEGYLRLSYANSLENIEEGLNRLESYMENR